MLLDRLTNNKGIVKIHMATVNALQNLLRNVLVDFWGSGNTKRNAFVTETAIRDAKSKKKVLSRIRVQRNLVVPTFGIKTRKVLTAL